MATGAIYVHLHYSRSSGGRKKKVPDIHVTAQSSRSHVHGNTQAIFLHRFCCCRSVVEEDESDLLAGTVVGVSPSAARRRRRSRPRSSLVRASSSPPTAPPRRSPFARRWERARPTRPELVEHAHFILHGLVHGSSMASNVQSECLGRPWPLTRAQDGGVSRGLVALDALAEHHIAPVRKAP